MPVSTASLQRPAATCSEHFGDAPKLHSHVACACTSNSMRIVTRCSIVISRAPKRRLGSLQWLVVSVLEPLAFFLLPGMCTFRSAAGRLMGRKRRAKRESLDDLFSIHFGCALLLPSEPNRVQRGDSAVPPSTVQQGFSYIPLPHVHHLSVTHRQHEAG